MTVDHGYNSYSRIFTFMKNILMLHLFIVRSQVDHFSYYITIMF